MNKKLKVTPMCTGMFMCKHPNCNVLGFGRTPGEAIRNWQFWYNIPY